MIVFPRMTAMLMMPVLIAALACDAAPDEEEEISAGPWAALVVTSDYQTGSYSVVDTVTLKSHNDVDIVHQDSVCRYDPVTRLPYIIARMGSDAIDIVDPGENWRIINEYSTGAGSNPQDIAVVSRDRAYVALYEESFLLIVNPVNGSVTDSVDLSRYADDDGIPETSWLSFRDGVLYALLQRLDREAGFRPSDYSLLLVLDADTGKVEKSMKLACANPFPKLRYSKALQSFVIIESGIFSTMVDEADVDGCIEFFDPGASALSGPVVMADELGGDIVDAVVSSETKAYAIIGKRRGSSSETHLVSFNPSTGKKTGTIVASEGWDYASIELSPDGSQLWMADRTMNSPSIRIFDTESDEETAGGPIDVGLPPSMICFVNAAAH